MGEGRPIRFRHCFKNKKAPGSTRRPEAFDQVRSEERDVGKKNYLLLFLVAFFFVAFLVAFFFVAFFFLAMVPPKMVVYVDHQMIFIRLVYTRDPYRQ
jgi:hypothetical protein